MQVKIPHLNLPFENRTKLLLQLHQFRQEDLIQFKHYNCFLMRAFTSVQLEPS